MAVLRLRRLFLINYLKHCHSYVYINKNIKGEQRYCYRLSRKFNLGAENIIARIALTYSLSKDRLLSLTDIADSQGKEYSKNVLFGNNLPYYIGLICVKYGLYKQIKIFHKYIKLTY
mgnify:FL=1